ncbi:hypothetical protein HK098_004751 [Nowakowskiella sp. JEL0407]|nr:hypothetical protein HK098_004751 [Nowakowskiella sp. JEL0407]
MNPFAVKINNFLLLDHDHAHNLPVSPVYLPLLRWLSDKLTNINEIQTPATTKKSRKKSKRSDDDHEDDFIDDNSLSDEDSESVTQNKNTPDTTQILPAFLLLGPSGCGKSNLINTIARALNQEIVEFTFSNRRAGKDFAYLMEISTTQNVINGKNHGNHSISKFFEGKNGDSRDGDKAADESGNVKEYWRNLLKTVDEIGIQNDLLKSTAAPTQSNSSSVKKNGKKTKRSNAKSKKRKPAKRRKNNDYDSEDDDTESGFDSFIEDDFDEAVDNIDEVVNLLSDDDDQPAESVSSRPKRNAKKVTDEKSTGIITNWFQKLPSSKPKKDVEVPETTTLSMTVPENIVPIFLSDLDHNTTASNGSNSVTATINKEKIIVIKDADLLSSEDKGFWNGVLNLLQKTKRHVVLVCNDNPLHELNPNLTSPQLTSLQRLIQQPILPPMTFPTISESINIINSKLESEDVLLSNKEILERFIVSCKLNPRLIHTQLDYVIKSTEKPDSSSKKTPARTITISLNDLPNSSMFGRNTVTNSLVDKFYSEVDGVSTDAKKSKVVFEKLCRVLETESFLEGFCNDEDVEFKFCSPEVLLLSASNLNSTSNAPAETTNTNSIAGFFSNASTTTAASATSTSQLATQSSSNTPDFLPCYKMLVPDLPGRLQYEPLERNERDCLLGVKELKERLRLELLGSDGTYEEVELWKEEQGYEDKRKEMLSLFQYYPSKAIPNSQSTNIFNYVHFLNICQLNSAKKSINEIPSFAIKAAANTDSEDSKAVETGSTNEEDIEIEIDDDEIPAGKRNGLKKKAVVQEYDSADEFMTECDNMYGGLRRSKRIRNQVSSAKEWWKTGSEKRQKRKVWCWVDDVPEFVVDTWKFPDI